MNGSDGTRSVGFREKLFGRNRWNFPLMVIAVIVLAGSFTALAYVKLTEKSTDEIKVNNVSYDWDEMREIFNITDMNGHTGYPLSHIIIHSGVVDPGTHEYRVEGSDGYMKTYSWDDMENGLLVEDGKKVVFPEKERAFWVQNVVSIEVL